MRGLILSPNTSVHFIFDACGGRDGQIYSLQDELEAGYIPFLTKVRNKQLDEIGNSVRGLYAKRSPSRLHVYFRPTPENAGIGDPFNIVFSSPPGSPHRALQKPTRECPSLLSCLHIELIVVSRVVCLFASPLPCESLLYSLEPSFDQSPCCATGARR